MTKVILDPKHGFVSVGVMDSYRGTVSKYLHDSLQAFRVKNAVFR